MLGATENGPLNVSSESPREYLGSPALSGTAEFWAKARERGVSPGVWAGVNVEV